MNEAHTEQQRRRIVEGLLYEASLEVNPELSDHDRVQHLKEMMNDITVDEVDAMINES